MALLLPFSRMSERDRLKSSKKRPLYSLLVKLEKFLISIARVIFLFCEAMRAVAENILLIFV